MKFTAWMAALALVLGSTLTACHRDSDRAASGGSSASSSSGQTPTGGATGQKSEGSTTPGAAPKRPASPAGSGSK